MIKMADTEKISGQSLNGKKFILNPVNKETMANITKNMEDRR
jgi:hypothetical protein